MYYFSLNLELRDFFVMCLFVIFENVFDYLLRFTYFINMFDTLLIITLFLLAFLLTRFSFFYSLPILTDILKFRAPLHPVYFEPPFINFKKDLRLPRLF